MSDLATDIQDIERLLSRPGALPGEFSTWIIYWLTQNIDISSYQLRGLASTFFRAAVPVGPEGSTGNGFMTSLPGGPILEGLPDGRWLAFWGCNFATQGGDSVGLMGCSPNGIIASDEQAAKGRTIDDADFLPMVYTREFTCERATTTSCSRSTCALPVASRASRTAGCAR